jgi:hypothetical protein
MLALVLRKDGGTQEKVRGMGLLIRRAIPKVYKNNRYIDISRRKKYLKHLPPDGHPQDGNRVLTEW